MNASPKKTLSVPADARQVLGIDFGTSGVRACLIERRVDARATSKASFPAPNQDRILAKVRANYGQGEQCPDTWLRALESVLKSMLEEHPLDALDFIVCDATSSSVLLTDAANRPLSETMMYFRQDATAEAEDVDRLLSRQKTESAAQGAASTLCKVLYLLKQTDSTLSSVSASSSLQIRHQVDIINYALCGSSKTDYNNALKLGFDAQSMHWPEWILQLLRQHHPSISLPEVVEPGSILGKISSQWVENFSINPHCKVCAGTTDSIAGFLASGAERIGDAVTSLGTTLAVKLLSSWPVFSSRYGIYSHRLGNQWLVGGASNTGGNSLLAHYSLEELTQLLQSMQAVYQLHSEKYALESLINCFKCTFSLKNLYPLASSGERFPISDPQLQPSLPPAPRVALQAALQSKDPEFLREHCCFLFGLMYALADVERIAYLRLEEMGASSLETLFSVGGGNKNILWTALRHELISASHKPARNQDAAYGVTRLIKL
ncbi:FGGY-family carbohydrate kinase [Thiomicrorhabdus sp.]|uniref:FGGY-family carbohydrate kinase n=1 Tax=Thiomicrorhabdus sp. TaxID=2039724 RepID=UPI0029C624C6|nr:FGGY-family carbohydrate kinase [Thiomicrorhabdus sp.]